MTENDYWAVISECAGQNDRPGALKLALEKLTDDQLIEFQQHFDSCFDAAYRWDLWGAAYVIGGGCSDDGFMDFRYGLIAMGRDVFQSALANPDSLVDVEGAENIADESLGYVCGDVYQARTGSDIPRDTHSTDEDMGDEWDFDDEALNRQHLPRLTEAYW